jgi:hypothetical protein
VRVEIERGIFIPNICFGGKLVEHQHVGLFVLENVESTMLMMTIFGLMGVADEQSGEASLFANALTRSWLVNTERCFGFECVRAKDEAKASAAKILERQRVMSFMLMMSRVCYHGKECAWYAGGRCAPQYMRSVPSLDDVGNHLSCRDRPLSGVHTAIYSSSEDTKYCFQGGFSSFKEGPRCQSTPLGDMTGRIVFLSEAGVRIAVFSG